MGGTAVVLGALGAHALETRLSPEALDSFETAVRYQLYHALALLALGLSTRADSFAWVSTGWMVGTLLFSGSIYGLVFLPPNAPIRSVLGPITPFGGLVLIAGWTGLLIKSIGPKSGSKQG